MTTFAMFGIANFRPIFKATQGKLLSISGNVKNPIKFSRISASRADFNEDLCHIGIVIMCNDHGVEREISGITRYFDGAVLHVSRARSYVGLDRHDVARAIEEASSLILPHGKLASVGYACSSGSFILDHQMIFNSLTARREVRTDVFTIRTAVLGALKALNISTIALLTPYDKETTTLIVENLMDAGAKTVDVGYLDLTTDLQLASFKSEKLLQHAMSLDSPDTEAIVVLCNALQTLEVVPELERRLKKPVIASNHALLWQCLRSTCQAKLATLEHGLLFQV